MSCSDLFDRFLLSNNKNEIFQVTNIIHETNFYKQIPICHHKNESVPVVDKKFIDRTKTCFIVNISTYNEYDGILSEILKTELITYKKWIK